MPLLSHARTTPLLLSAMLLAGAIGLTGTLGWRSGLGAQSAPTASGLIHAPFDALLKQHVRNGLVDYDAFARAPEFARYLETLARTTPTSLSRNEQLALWINAYNAYTIQLINVHNERESIKNINRAFGFLKAGGPWREPLAAVGGTNYTLDEIEHERIRPVFNEPRVHFALVCAAVSCPPLRNEAYVGARLDAQLDDQGVQFLRHSPAKNRVDVATGTVYLSRIFDWYGKDFASSTPGVLSALARYLPAGAEQTLLAGGRARVKWTAYDWALNRQP